MDLYVKAVLCVFALVLVSACIGYCIGYGVAWKKGNAFGFCVGRDYFKSVVTKAFCDRGLADTYNETMKVFLDGVTEKELSKIVDGVLDMCRSRYLKNL